MKIANQNPLDVEAFHKMTLQAFNAALDMVIRIRCFRGFADIDYVRRTVRLLDEWASCLRNQHHANRLFKDAPNYKMIMARASHDAKIQPAVYAIGSVKGSSAHAAVVELVRQICFWLITEPDGDPFAPPWNDDDALIEWWKERESRLISLLPSDRDEIVAALEKEAAVATARTVDQRAAAPTVRNTFPMSLPKKAWAAALGCAEVADLEAMNKSRDGRLLVEINRETFLIDKDACTERDIQTIEAYMGTGDPSKPKLLPTGPNSPELRPTRLLTH